jgi:hypothetical protein
LRFTRIPNVLITCVAGRWVIVGAGVIFELATFYLVKRHTYHGPVLRGVEEATEIVLEGQKADAK